MGYPHPDQASTGFFSDQRFDNQVSSAGTGVHNSLVSMTLFHSNYALGRISQGMCFYDIFYFESNSNSRVIRVEERHLNRATVYFIWLIYTP